MYNDYLNQILDIYKDYLPYIIASNVIAIAVRAFMALAVHNDAKARTIKVGTVYTVLTVFFPIIVPIIYIIARPSLKTSAPKLCPVCSATLAPEYKYCPRCNAANLISYEAQDAKKRKKSAKVFLILAVCFYVSSVILSGIYGVKMSNEISKRVMDGLNDYSQGDNGDFDYFNDFDFDEDGDGDSSDSGDSAADDFNNFGN